MFLAVRQRDRHSVPVLAAACFAGGLTVGALVAPVIAGRAVEPAAAMTTSTAISPSDLRGAHSANVLRVLDGDTFEARVNIWPGMQITTRVRLRGIDAPEMSARCVDERIKAEAARDALVRILNEGSVGISRIGQDKYGGRVDADVSTARTADVSVALAERGLVRRYTAGKRESWVRLN